MTAKKTQVSFEDVLAVVLEGMRLGIIDDIDINCKKKQVDFYYGGFTGDNDTITFIWFKNGEILEHNKENLVELEEKVREARSTA